MTASVTSIKLGKGDNPSTGYVELAGDAGSDPYVLLPDSLDLGSGKLEMSLVSGAGRDGEDLTNTRRGNREISGALDIQGADVSEVIANLQAINDYLALAADYASSGEGDAIVLTVFLKGQPDPIFFDVVGGECTPPKSTPTLWTMDIPLIREAVLSIKAKPYGRRVVEVGSESATITNNGSATVDLGNVGGDAPALVQLWIKDTSADVIQRVRAAIRPERLGGLNANYTWAHSFAPSGTGATQPETDSLNGASVVRASSLAADWTTYASLTVTSHIAENSGLAIGYIRFRDTTGIVVPAMDVPEAGLLAGGSLATGTAHVYRITALTADGETPASSSISRTPFWFYRAVKLRWGYIPSATGYRVYRSVGGGTEQYKEVASGSTTSFVDDGSVVWTTGSPPNPTVALRALAEVRLLYGFPYDEPTEMLSTSPMRTSVGGGKFELLKVPNPLHLPPRQVPTGRMIPGWRIDAQARLTSNGAGSVDFDGFLTLPYFGAMAQAYVPDLRLTTKRTFMLDQAADESYSAVLADVATQDVISGLAADGRLIARPGNNTAFIMVNRTGDVHSCLDTVTVKALITERVLYL